MGAYEYGLMCYLFTRVMSSLDCVGECLKENEAGFCLGFDVVCTWFEC